MKTKRKLLALLLGLIAAGCLILAACGGSSGPKITLPADRYDVGTGGDLTLTVDFNGGSFQSLKDNGQIVDGTNYLLDQSGGKLTVLGVYLQYLELGTHTFTMTTDKGSTDFKLELINAVSTSFDTSVKSYVYGSGAGIAIPTDFSTATVTSLRIGTTRVDAQFYDYADGSFILKPALCESLYGTTNFTLLLSNNDSYQFQVVSDCLFNANFELGLIPADWYNVVNPTIAQGWDGNAMRYTGYGSGGNLFIFHNKGEELGFGLGMPFEEGKIYCLSFDVKNLWDEDFAPFGTIGLSNMYADGSAGVFLFNYTSGELHGGTCRYDAETEVYRFKIYLDAPVEGQFMNAYCGYDPDHPTQKMCDLLFDNIVLNEAGPMEPVLSESSVTYPSGSRQDVWISGEFGSARIASVAVKGGAALESGSVALGSEAAFNRYAISFYTYLVEKREAYVNAQGTDEWFIDLTQNAGVKDFAVRFFDVNDANAALITKISIGVNSDGRLVVTLWRDYSGLKDWDGVILRDVLVESSYAGDEVKVDAIEAYFQSLESLEELEKAIADAKAIESELYTEASYAALQTAIADAEAVAAKGNCTVEEISEASGRLGSAIQSLVKRASLQDVAELNNLLLKAGFYTESKYTQASYAALSDAVAAAQELLNAGSDEPSALQERIGALASAIDGLVLAVDKAELNALIALIQELNTEDCTAESRAALMSALAAAQEVSGNAEAAQADVDGAVQALKGARLELKLAASSRAALEAALGEVGGIGNDDASYTQESYDAFAEVRTLAAEALVDSDLSEEDCLALIHMLNGRYSELERTDFVADGTTAASIKNWIDNTFCDGLGEYMGIAVSGYSFTVEYPDGAQRTYVSKVGKYFYDVTAQNGYIKTEKLIHQFALENGAVVLGDACFNLAGTYLATYFSHVGISDVGYFSGALTRIGNSNEWFSTDTRWISFVPGLNGVYGVGFILQDDVLTVKVYAGAGLAATPVANRTELLCTVTFDRIGSAGVAELDAFLAGGIRAGQAEVVQALQLLRDNYALVNLATGTRIIRTDNYYFDGKEGYILKDGKVHQLFYIEGAYRIGGVVYVNGQQATSIDQLVPSVSGLKAITAEQLSLFYDDWYETQVEASYYLVTDASGEVNAEIAALMAQLAGLTLSEDESMPCLSFSVTGSGCICIVEGDMTGVRPDNFYTFTEVGSASDAEIEALLN